MTILGIDPGTNKVGYGIIKKDKNQFLLINYGCFNIKSKSINENLVKIQKEIEKLIQIYKPNIAAIEQIFFFKNKKTAINIAQSRGVIITTLMKANIEIKEFTPLQIKQSVCGYGKADKNQVQKMIKLIFKLKDVPKPDDAADAIATAFCASNIIKSEL